MDGLGPEFGSDAGNKAFIVRALCELKSAGVLFCSHLADCMQHMDFAPCWANQWQCRNLMYSVLGVCFEYTDTSTSS